MSACNRTLLVISKPNAPYLRLLEKLPSSTDLIVGNQIDIFREAAPRADAIVNCINPGLPLKEVWKLAPQVKWVHSMSAGLENTLFPELIESPVPMTNSRGVFARSLGEFALASILFFAKDLRRMVRNQEAGRWEQFDIGEIHGQTLGVLGFGELGRAGAVRAHALGMRILACRRRTANSSEDPIVSKTYATEERKEMFAECDFILVSAAQTKETIGLIGEAEIAAMKPNAVIINIGRGPIIVESALVKALTERRIRGAALDVFDQEPLPEAHPFYKLDNVLLSPHCADHTPTWTDEAMQFFVDNYHRYDRGEPLQNIVDKRSGY